MKDTVRVIMVDDHPLFREGMRGRLDRVGDITVVGEAASGDEAVARVRNVPAEGSGFRPDWRDMGSEV
jgi:DNA-binding NarL/FixJ family response regulator